MNEHQAREHVRKLRRFYTDALIYGAVNLGLILIWAIAGGGYFWPIWVIVGWGIGLGVHAFSLGLIPQVNGFLPFMTSEWEEQEIRRLMRKKQKEAGAEKHAVKIEVKSEAKPTIKTKKLSTPKKAAGKKKHSPKA